MKSILKFLPVALGVLTMASCSNEDFFGSETQKNGKELIPTVENLVNADGGTTRSSWTAGGTYQVSWTNGDQFRVYDEAVQAYDIFSRKAAGITIDGTADVAAHKYAIFPGDKVSYAGWDKTAGISAVMEIADNWTYLGSGKVTFGNELKTVYASDLPMWGDVNNETSENLEVDLKFLTSVLDVCVWSKATQKIRVVAFKDDSALGTGTIDAGGTPTGDGTPTAALANFADVAGQETPLSGYFFAQLKEGGQLVKNMTQPLANEYGYILEVNVPATVGEEAHVLIPIIPATYKYLSVQYLVPEGGSGFDECWVELNHYADTEIKRGQVRKTGLEIGTEPASTTIQVSSLADLNTKLATAATLTDRIINVELKSGGSLATTSTAYTLSIPGAAKDLAININAAIDASAQALTIDGGNASNVATLNIIGGVTGTKGVTVNTTGALKLGGNYGGNMTITSAKDVTLGLGLESSFTTGNVVKNNATGNVIVDANEGTITDISLNADTDVNGITVNSGTVTTIGKAKAAKGAVTINGGTLTTINTTTGAITVIDGTATNLVTTTGDLNIGALSEVKTVETSATTFNAGTDLEKLTMTGTGSVALTVSATIDEIVAKYREDETTSTLTITSTGNASIKKVTNNNGTRTTITYGAANWTGGGEAAAEATADANGIIPIYTVSQLASVTAGKKYKLMAASYNISGQEWTPVNVSADFDGNAKTITGLTNSLFATISGGTIKNLTLNNVANATAANTGALAQTVTGSPTIQGITVGTTSVIGATTGTANSKNIGGLVGTVNGTTVNFIDNKVTATVKGYANVGGLIGNVAGGTVNIKTTKADATLASNVTFNKTYKPTVAATASDANCGTFGNLIGSITGTGVTVFIGKEGSTAGAGNQASYFFTDGISTVIATHATDVTKLDFALNRTFNGAVVAKTFKGASTAVIAGDVAFTNAIGYSTGSITKLTMFNKSENALGYDWTIDDINEFQ